MTHDGLVCKLLRDLASEWVQALSLPLYEMICFVDLDINSIFCDKQWLTHWQHRGKNGLSCNLHADVKIPPGDEVIC